MRNLSIWLVDPFLIWPMKSAYSAIKGFDWVLIYCVVCIIQIFRICTLRVGNPYGYFQLKRLKHFFLPGIHQKYSSNSKCVDRHAIRMKKKHKNLTFWLILRKKLGSPRFESSKKFNGQPKKIDRHFFLLDYR
jgi:hypothetical protein